MEQNEERYVDYEKLFDDLMELLTSIELERRAKE